MVFDFNFYCVTVKTLYSKNVKQGHRIDDILYLAINQSIFIYTSYHKNGLPRSRARLSLMFLPLLDELKIRMKSNSKIIVSKF